MKDGGQAFPQGKVYVAPNQQMMDSGPQGGMSLRDYFAAKAMHGMIPSRNDPARSQSLQWIAEASYCMADAMLAEREKQS